MEKTYLYLPNNVRLLVKEEKHIENLSRLQSLLDEILCLVSLSENINLTICNEDEKKNIRYYGYRLDFCKKERGFIFLQFFHNYITIINNKLKVYPKKTLDGLRIDFDICFLSSFELNIENKLSSSLLESSGYRRKKIIINFSKCEEVFDLLSLLNQVKSIVIKNI